MKSKFVQYYVEGEDEESGDGRAFCNRPAWQRFVILFAGAGMNLLLGLCLLGFTTSQMDLLGTTNMAAYLRKMAIDGYAVNLDLPELRELVSLLRRSGNNLNQLTKRVHETSRFYDADLEDLRQSFDRLWEAAQKILSALSALQ